MNKTRRDKKREKKLCHYQKSNTEINEKLSSQIEENEKLSAQFQKLRKVCHFQQQKLKANLELHEIDPLLISKFKENSFLGKGTFGTVDLSEFQGYPVAVKHFKPRYSSKEDVIREATIMSKLSHKNLPYLFGVCTKVAPYSLVSRFCGIEGQSVTVHDALAREDNSSLPWTTLMEESCSALSYLHNAGYLHNDIKSDNLLLTKSSSNSEEESVHMILNDLGKATLVAEGKLYNLTPTDKEKYYKFHNHIAPEVIEGEAPQSIKSDTFSLGIIFYDVSKAVKDDELRKLAKSCTRSNPSLRCDLHDLVVKIRAYTLTNFSD
jgi:serine/threonine protein kinase